MAKIEQANIGGLIPASVWEMETCTASQIDAGCGLGKGVNLLDNWYFGSGVINQSGNSTYSGARYTVDRWYTQVTTTQVKAVTEGLRVENKSGSESSATTINLVQKIEPNLIPFLKGKTLTASAIVYSSTTTAELYVYASSISSANLLGTASLTEVVEEGKPALLSSTFTFPQAGTSIYFVLRTVQPNLGSVTWAAAKLELGTISTLAYVDNSKNLIQLDPPPNISLELLKCRRYRLMGAFIAPGLAVSGGNPLAVVFTQTRMRVTPTLIGTPNAYSIETGVTITGLTFKPTTLYQNGVRILVEGTTTPVYLNFPSGTGLSADL